MGLAVDEGEGAKDGNVDGGDDKMVGVGVGVYIIEGTFGTRDGVDVEGGA